MLKKINNFINILMGGFIGVFVGGTISKYLDYHRISDLNNENSAPWYTDILISGIILMMGLIICIVIKIIIRKKLD